MMEDHPYLYLIEVACPHCREVTAFVEGREDPIPIDREVHVEADGCPHCHRPVSRDGGEWDRRAEYEVEIVEPTEGDE